MAILEIKRHFLIEPLFGQALQRNIDLEQGMPAFGSAMVYALASCYNGRSLSHQ